MTEAEAARWEQRALNTAALRDEIARLGPRITLGGSIEQTRRKVAASGLDPFTYFGALLAECERRGIKPADAWKAGVRGAEGRIVLRGFRSLDGRHPRDLHEFFRHCLRLPPSDVYVSVLSDTVANMAWKSARNPFRHLRTVVWREGQIKLAKLRFAEFEENAQPCWLPAISRCRERAEERERTNGKRASGFAAAQGREVAVNKVCDEAGRGSGEQGQGQRPEPPEIVLSVSDGTERVLAIRRQWDARMAKAQLSENERAVLNLMRDKDLDPEEACAQQGVTRRVYQNAARKMREVKLLEM